MTAIIAVLFTPGQSICFSQPDPEQTEGHQDDAFIPPPDPVNAPPPKPAEIKKLGENRVRIGTIIVDTKKREVTVPGRILRDQTLEFLATKKNGYKSYESAMELDTNAVSFNLALIMIGLERTHAEAPKQHFDTSPAVGDPVELWVEWSIDGRTHKIEGDKLLYDLEAKRVPNLGQWVYTGSGFLPNGHYLAELDGVLIGFIHDPASIIENTTGAGINAYGSIRLNPELHIPPDTPIKLTVRAISK